VVAATMRDCSRPSDVLGRWGGDEFVIVAPVLDSHNALVFAQRMRRLVASASSTVDGRTLSASISIGVAVIRPDESPTMLMERAGAAMRLAKERGRDHARVG